MLKAAIEEAAAVKSAVPEDRILVGAAEAVIELRSAVADWDWHHAYRILDVNDDLLRGVSRLHAEARGSVRAWAVIEEEVGLVRAQIAFSDAVMEVVEALSRGAAAGDIGYLDTATISVAELGEALTRATTLGDTLGAHGSSGGSGVAGARWWEDEPFKMCSGKEIEVSSSYEDLSKNALSWAVHKWKVKKAAKQAASRRRV
eukprot:g5907.t1